MMNIKLLPYVVVIAMTFSCKSQQEGADEIVSSTPEIAETRTQAGDSNQQGERGDLPHADIMMRSMDIDGDGKLARTELRGRSAERFDELDADGDGYITKAELENSPEPLMRSGGDPR